MFFKFYKKESSQNQITRERKTVEKKILKLVIFFIFYFLISVSPLYILYWLSKPIQLNTNENFSIIPTLNFYITFDNLSITSIFLTYIKIAFESITVYCADEKIRMCFKSIVKEIRLCFSRNFSTNQPQVRSRGVRDLTMNPQIPPHFLRENQNDFQNVYQSARV